MPDHHLPFPANPNFGGGATRRRVRIEGGQGAVTAVLSDIFHEMRCRIACADGRIEAIEGDTVRVPTSLCPGAVAELQELVGVPVDTPPRELYAGGRARRHCTHLFDLAVLAMAFAARGETAPRIYEAVVPDEVEAPVTIAIHGNGVLLHRWTVRRGALLEPAELAGRSLLAGFAAWSSACFAGPEWEAAMVLARTYMIAGGRGYLTDAWKGRPIALHDAIIGACYSYAPARVGEGVFSGDNVRDFSAGVVEGS